MKTWIFAMLCALLMTGTFTSCNQYKSASTATRVSQLAGNPFMYQLAKALLKQTKNFMSESGNKSSVKLNLLTPLASVFSQGDQVMQFKQMLAKEYAIPTKKLDQGFGKLRTMQDLLLFVRQQGRSFNFYSSPTLF